MTSEPIYRTGAQTLRDPRWLQQNSGWGSYRAGHEAVQGEEVRGILMRMPPGQRSPWHGASGWPKLGEAFPGIGAGAIYLAVQGEVEFSSGGATYLMHPRDMIFVNAVPYRYANIGFDDVLFWTLRNSLGEGMGPSGATPRSSRIWQGDDSAEAMLGNDQPYYGMKEPEHIPEELERMGIIHWDDYRRQTIEWHGEFGHIWGAYPSVNFDVSARYVRVPPGQSAQIEGRPRETLFIGTGGVPLSIQIQEAITTIEIHDALVVPSGTPFTLINAEGTDALIFEMQASTEQEQ